MYRLLRYTYWPIEYKYGHIRRRQNINIYIPINDAPHKPIIFTRLFYYNPLYLVYEAEPQLHHTLILLCFRFIVCSPWIHINEQMILFKSLFKLKSHEPEKNTMHFVCLRRNVHSICNIWPQSANEWNVEKLSQWCWDKEIGIDLIETDFYDLMLWFSPTVRSKLLLNRTFLEMNENSRQIKGFDFVFNFSCFEVVRIGTALFYSWIFWSENDLDNSELWCHN